MTEVSVSPACEIGDPILGKALRLLPIQDVRQIDVRNQFAGHRRYRRSAQHLPPPRRTAGDEEYPEIAWERLAAE
jgi:hypothetical protein